MNIGAWEINRICKTEPAPARVYAGEYAGDGVAMISIIDNGYLLTMSSGNGERAKVRYVANPEDVGKEFAVFVAKTQLGK